MDGENQDLPFLHNLWLSLVTLCFLHRLCQTLGFIHAGVCVHVVLWSNCDFLTGRTNLQALCSAYKEEHRGWKGLRGCRQAALARNCCWPQSSQIIHSLYWIVILMGLFKGHFNSLLVSTDTHWKAFGIPPSCNILIFTFLRTLTACQVTVTMILCWHIPRLAVAGLAHAVCCPNSMSLRFIAFSYYPPLLRPTLSFFCFNSLIEYIAILIFGISKLYSEWPM